jgi:hypothetical protein
MTEPTQTEAPAAPGLTIQDLTLTLQVVQVATSRGAFKADELTAVGGLYDRLFKFLDAAGAITKTPPAETAAPAAPEVTETKAAKKAKA